MYTAT